MIAIINDHFYTESSGAGIGTGVDGKNSSPFQNLNFYPSGSTTLSLKNGSSKTEQTTKATIGNGNITTGSTITFDADGNLESKTGGTLISSSDGTIIDSTQLTNLNRDVTKTQEITKDQMTGALDITTTIDNRIFSEKGREQMAKEQKDLGKNVLTNPANPIGMSLLIESYTGRELSWASGDVARFKEKGREFETSVDGALTIGMANTIDPKDADRLYLIGQPINSDPDYYKTKLTWANESGGVSLTNIIPGFNSMSVFHDKFTEETSLGKPGLLQLSIFPAIPINYYGLIGKSIRNIYEDPKNNKSIGVAK